MVREGYGNVLGDGSPVKVESEMASVVKDDDDWELGDMFH